MRFNGVDALQRAGFSGFRTIQNLRQSDWSDVPDKPGIYLVVRCASSYPRFLTLSRGGHLNGRDPSVPIHELEAEWVNGTIVLYIGQAGGGRSNHTLKRRLRQYIDFGYGEPSRHRGGRFIWQLRDCYSLLVCWRQTRHYDPLEVEGKLIQEFKGVYGARPFANLRG